jgi:hypothetical protein
MGNIRGYSMEWRRLLVRTLAFMRILGVEGAVGPLAIGLAATQALCARYKPRRSAPVSAGESQHEDVSAIYIIRQLRDAQGG